MTNNKKYRAFVTNNKSNFVVTNQTILTDKDERTYLIYCCFKKYSKNALKAIKTYGLKCKPERIDNGLNTALIWCCYNKIESVASKLIDRFGLRCNPGQIDHNNCTALTWCCQYKLENVAILLIEKFGLKCNPGHADQYDTTALIWCCYNKMESVAILLIETFGSKCNLSCIDDEKYTALMWCCKKKMKNLALLLIETFGPKCNFGQVNDDGKSVMDYCDEYEMPEVKVKIQEIMLNIPAESVVTLLSKMFGELSDENLQIIIKKMQQLELVDCCVCMNTVVPTYRDCGHTNTCVDCTKRMKNSSICPICRDISTTNKLNYEQTFTTLIKN